MRPLHLACITTLAVAAAQAASAHNMRAGLWERELTISGGGAQAALAQAQQRMAEMSPQDRERVRAMMQAQGMSMGGPGQPIKARVCVTPEQAARQEMPDPDGRCRNSGYTRSGDTVRFRFTCEPRPDGNGGGSGEGEFTLVSDTEHRGKMAMETMRKGQKVRMDMQFSGRWLQADCGGVPARAERMVRPAQGAASAARSRP
jgi:hypothetical protein